MKKIPAFWIMLQPGGKFLFVVLLSCFCPFICYITFLLGVIRLVCCIVAWKRVNLNKKLVPDPFTKMIFVSDSRYIENKVNSYCAITPIEFSQRLTDIGVSTESINLFASKFEAKFQRGKAIKVMLYTKKFEEYYTKVCYKMWERNHLSIIIIFGSMGVSLHFTMLIFYN